MYIFELQNFGNPYPKCLNSVCIRPKKLEQGTLAICHGPVFRPESVINRPNKPT